MTFLIPAMLAFSVASANAQAPKPAYPGCDMPAQHVLKGTTGGSLKEAMQAHIVGRIGILQADIRTARKAGRLTRTKAAALLKRTTAVQRDVHGFVVKQGFLSAAERASYDRELDGIAMQLCR